MNSIDLLKPYRVKVLYSLSGGVGFIPAFCDFPLVGNSSQT